jgi:hypothetical protein
MKSVTDRFIMFVLKTAGGKIQRTELSTITELSDETIRQAENRLIFDNRIRKNGLFPQYPGLCREIVRMTGRR